MFNINRKCFGLAALLVVACSGTDADPPLGAGGRDSAAGASGAANAGEANSGSAGENAEAAADSGTGGDADDEESDGGASDGGASGEAGRATNGGSAGKSGASAGGSLGHSGGAGGDMGMLMIPCDVNTAYTVCRNCHSNPTVNSAPFPLVTLEDVQAFAVMESAAVSTGVMPAAGTLSAADKKLIVDWLDAGAVGVPIATCP